MKLPLKVINLWAGPGAGKSTAAAGLFNLMKNLGCRVELVTEIAKDLTYEQNYGYLQNQLWMLANQDLRLRRLVGQVEWAITDSPLPLGEAYTSAEYEEWLPDTIGHCYHRYDNYDFFVQRVKPYANYGRTQTQSEALALDIQVKDLFRTYTDPTQAWHIVGDFEAPYSIADILGLIHPGSRPAYEPRPKFEPA